MDAQLQSPLARVPLELLLRITSSPNMTTQDLANVRLTCKKLEQSLFHFFSHEFFRKKQFMVFSDSLQALVDISHHANLSPCLKHVVIGTDQLPVPPWQVAHSNLNEQQQRKLEDAVADQAHLFTSGVLRDMLADAFRHLPNLETVDIRDFDSNTRRRDETQWKSYGSRSLEASTGLKVTHAPGPGGPNSSMFASDIFSAALAALAVAQARPRGIEMVLQYGQAVMDSALRIPPQLQAPVIAVLSNLRKLHLALFVTGLAAGNDHYFAKTLLQHTPNLTWLRLNFVSKYGRGPVESTNSMLQWLAFKPGAAILPPPVPNDPPFVDFPALERLDLGRIGVTADSFVDLMTKFSTTLRTISLRRVTLHDRHAVEDKANGWAALARRLRGINGLELNAIELSLLAYKPSDAGGGRGYIARLSSEDNPSAKTTGDIRRFSGLPARQLLEKVGQDINIEWPQVSSNALAFDGDSDEEGGESDQDEMDEDEDEE
jgi:hypothetical protein